VLAGWGRREKCSPTGAPLHTKKQPQSGIKAQKKKQERGKAGPKTLGRINRRGVKTSRKGNEVFSLAVKTVAWDTG